MHDQRQPTRVVLPRLVVAVVLLIHQEERVQGSVLLALPAAALAAALGNLAGVALRGGLRVMWRREGTLVRPGFGL